MLFVVFVRKHKQNFAAVYFVKNIAFYHINFEGIRLIIVYNECYLHLETRGRSDGQNMQESLRQS